MSRKVVLGSIITLGMLLAVLGIVSGQVIQQISPESQSQMERISPELPSQGEIESLVEPKSQVRTFRISCTNSEFATITSCIIGGGSCVSSHHPCFPYMCDPSTKTCAMGCESKDQCWSGTDCVGGKCVVQAYYCSADFEFSITTAGKKAYCSPYICDPNNGLCRESCTNQGHCLSGYSCDSTSSCVPG